MRSAKRDDVADLDILGLMGKAHKGVLVHHFCHLPASDRQKLRGLPRFPKTTQRNNVLATGRTPSARNVVRFSRIALVATIGLALLFALASDNVITYITRMISTILSGLFVSAMLGRFWPRYNWQGAIATLIFASATSLTIIANSDWADFWGNPSIPAVLAALAAGVIVSLITPASRVTSAQALAILDQERQRMEQAPEPTLTSAEVPSTPR